MQADDEDSEWRTIKAETFAIIMDFFASGLPVVHQGQTGATEHSWYLLLHKNISPY